MGGALVKPKTADPRGAVVHDAFATVADEFMQLVGTDKSGSVTVHFQNGVPLTHSWEFKGRTIPRRAISEQGDAA